MVRNIDIREAAKKADVKLWEIAQRYGCNDSNFSRKLRIEFSPEEKLKIKNIITDVKLEYQ